MTSPNVKLLAPLENSNGAARWIEWLLEIRLHHWLKNILVFVPLVLTPGSQSQQTLTECVLGFLILSVTCSGTYLLNDVFDREADRVHWSKCERPVASGRISMLTAVVTGIALSLLGILAAGTLNDKFATCLAAYVLLSLAYSYRLKTFALLDIAVLGSLFTLRIIIGMVLIGVELTLWLPLFTFVFFAGLSSAKRTAELVRRTQRDDHSPNRRGYLESDLSLLIAVGVTCSIGALIILCVYFSSVVIPGAVFQSSDRIWAAIPLLLAWVMRIWLLAVRGSLDDDPLLFSISDRFSQVVAVLMSAVVVAIHLA